MQKPHVFFGEKEYLMWIIIMLVLGLTALAAFAYLLTRFHGFSFVRALEGKNRLLSWAVALLPLLLLGANGNVRTIPLAVQGFIGSFVKQWNLIMVSTLLAMLPIIILYIFAQKYIVQGMVEGAVK